VPGLIDPNWKGNALDASPGEDSNNQIILTDNKYDKSYISTMTPYTRIKEPKNLFHILCAT